MRKILIISPHPDDEVLGCSCFVRGAAVAYVTEYHPGFPDGQNIRESLDLQKKYDIARHVIWSKETNRLDMAPAAALITELEILVNDLRPETVLIPNPSYNQDHRAVYEAARTALRPHDRNHFVPRVLAYEQPETFGTMQHVFDPVYFRRIDMKDKLRMVQIYRSQERRHRSFSHLVGIAKVRGMQAGCQFAEAFEVLRWVE